MVSEGVSTDNARYYAESVHGHAMGHLHDGVSYCLNRDCNASLGLNGPLENLTAAGPALIQECPWVQVPLEAYRRRDG